MNLNFIALTKLIVILPSPSFCTLMLTQFIHISLCLIYRTPPKNVVSSQMSAETELLKPINLEFQVKRNLSSTWFSKIPGLEVQGVLKAMNVSSLVMETRGLHTLMYTKIFFLCVHFYCLLPQFSSVYSVCHYGQTFSSDHMTGKHRPLSLCTVAN